MCRFAAYQTDHLFLLIGTNPLPNYVAARLLAHPETRFYLVHSDETQPVAERLAAKLGAEHSSFIPIEETDCKQILDSVTECARGLRGVGLHYTGGNKIMAVYAYRAIKQAHPHAVCTYLDERTHQLMVETPDGSFISYQLDIDPKVSFVHLLELNGYSLKQAPITSPQFAKEAELLAQADCGQLRQWCDVHLRDGGKRKKTSQLRRVSLAQLPTLSEWSSHGDLPSLAAHLGQSLEDVAEWLDGKWLEDYVLLSLQRIAGKCQLHDVAMDIQPNEREFQFDAVAMRGFQLFAISCTTSNQRGLIKSKLFEAYVRAEQMGGDGARVAVVSCAPASDSDPTRLPESIQAEVEEAWDAQRKVRVFGVKHLPGLGEHLKDWITHHHPVPRGRSRSGGER